MAKAGLDLVIGLVDNASSGLEKLTGGVNSFALVAGGAAVAGLAALGKAAFDAGQTYDGVMDSFATKTGASGEALDALGADFKKVFTSIPVDAETAGNAMANFTQKTGMTGTALQETSTKLLEMSRLMGGDAAANVAAYGEVVQKWGLSEAQASAELDKMFVAAQKSGVGVDALMQSVTKSGASLQALGFSLDESVAMLAKWEKEGVNSEAMLTGLRNASAKLTSGNAELSASMSRAQQDLVNEQEKLKGLQDQLELAKQKQAEFTDKTSESAKLAMTQKIEELTKAIGESKENVAALGNGVDQLSAKQAAAAAGGGKSLHDSLVETFDAIKNTKDEQDALGIAMDVFGKKAGGEMAAAIRSGKMSIDDLTAAMGEADGAIMKTAASTADFPEKLEVLKNKATTVLMPLGSLMVTGLTAAITALEPVIDKLIAWLETDLPPAIQTLTDAWNNVLLPALTAVWNFCNTYILPILQAVGSFMIDVLQKDIETFSMAWNTVLLPALTAVYNFINTYVIPVLKLVATWLRDNLPPAINTAKAAFETINRTIQDVKGAIDGAIAKYNELKNFLGGLHLPNPFQGILDALDKIKNFQMPSIPSIPNFNPFGKATGALSFAGGMTMVGERGPELVALPRGSRIYSNSETEQRLAGQGGDTFYVTVNAYGGDPAPVRQATMDGIQAARARSTLMEPY